MKNTFCPGRRHDVTCSCQSVNTCVVITLLAHLSQRLIGELIVYEGVRPSTFSNDISSEVVRPILFIFHI